MQLIAILILLATAIVLWRFSAFALRHRERSAEELFEATANITLNRIGDIGVSIVILAPRNEECIVQALSTLYPAIEVIVTIDAEREQALMSSLISRYSLISVNHKGIDSTLIRGLYRSRRRAFNSVIVIDMPAAELGYNTARQIASYDYTLCLSSDTHLEEFAVGRLVAALASELEPHNVAVVSRLGTSLRLEPQGIAHSGTRTHNLIRLLAWDTKGIKRGAIALIAAGPMLGLAAILTRSTLLGLAAVTMLTALLPILFISCRIAFSKSLFGVVPIIVNNFYDDLVVSIKKISYLYLPKH